MVRSNPLLISVYTTGQTLPTDSNLKVFYSREAGSTTARIYYIDQKSGALLVVASLRMFACQESSDMEIAGSNNCSTTDSFVIFHPLNGSDPGLEPELVLADDVKEESNVSHLKTLTLPKDWEDSGPKLNFPKISAEERFKMPGLHLDQGIFIFDFLRRFLFVVQPYDVPIGLITDAIESRITISALISKSMHVEAAFLGALGVCCVLACVIPGTELWLACRPIRAGYEPSRHPGVLAFFLGIFIFVIGSAMVTMMVCNELVSMGIEKLPVVAETAIQDLGDYHSGTAVQLRKLLTRSLDVASEAILVDLDNAEELLGKPVQAELAAETGLDVALDALLDVANATRELSQRAEALLQEGQRAKDLGDTLSREANDLRRELEAASRNCPPQDRSLCAVLEPSGLYVALRLERLLRDDRLLRLRGTGRENLTEVGRQARGEYLYVPVHVSRSTLDARNDIRREINSARSRIGEQARSLEISSSELSKHLDSARRVTGYIIPYLENLDDIRWFVGIGTVVCVLLVWSLLVAALCCRCGSSEEKTRPILLCSVLLACFVSIGLWGVFAMTLAISSHTEMLICRPLYDPDFRTVEAILETRAFLGRRLSLSLRDLFRKCEKNEAAYPAFQLGSSMKLEQLTAHWTWSGLSRALSRLKVDLKGLRILTPNLQLKLQSLFYACGPNLTEHRLMIQGPILNKDLGAMSDQMENVARQIKDRTTAREFDGIASSMRTLLSRRVKPLMKLQDELVYQLAALELQLIPLQRQVNQSISHLKTIQYYIDNQGEQIAQLKTKSYTDRLSGYLDQWRTHTLSEMGEGVAKCGPLWDILNGVRSIICQHILGAMDGFWFAVLICAIVMMASTPMSHALASVYRKESSVKEMALLASRTESPDTVVVEQETWRTPEPPPPQENW
ncbi:prominin-1-A [Orussus abietinus]|uniref:prominin-1-A n=1 Tax=Orussus abietinus TaxID=222816 RepID=UPI000C715DF9|nr:prominin-1-A [Orussus abietinus]